MSTVAERLVESWLDSQSERRYQPAFIQLLISEGWQVIHNTRHSPIELGKDVIARSPTGELYAFQLKGNPGRRLSKSQAQEILPQLLELLEIPVPEASRGKCERHIAVLVVNSEVDEEAQLAMHGVSQRTDSPLCAAKSFEVWGRGTLLRRFIDKVQEIWPYDLEGTRKLLELHVADGRSIPSPMAISDILSRCVLPPKSTLTSSEKQSKITSVFLLGELIKSPWRQRDNHYALYLISTLTTMYAMRFADTRRRRDMVEEHSRLALAHAKDLIDEAEYKNFDPLMTWSDYDLLAEFDIMTERARLVGDCAAAIVLSGESVTPARREYLKRLLEGTLASPWIWGQGAIPAGIVRYWALRRLDATPKPDFYLISMTNGLLGAARGKVEGLDGLPDPYHDFETCWAKREGRHEDLDSAIMYDTFRGRSWFITPLMYMIAKRNWKKTCKTNWKSYSKIIHEGADLSPHAFFDARLSDEGSAISSMYYDDTWTEFVKKAVGAGSRNFLEDFSNIAWVIASYISMVPYRAWTNVVMWLDGQLSETWYSSKHLPTSA